MTQHLPVQTNFCPNSAGKQAPAAYALGQTSQRDGATEDESTGLQTVCFVDSAATYVPVCCFPGPCFLCSCKMETFERGGNSFYVSF